MDKYEDEEQSTLAQNRASSSAIRAAARLMQTRSYGLPPLLEQPRA